MTWTKEKKSEWQKKWLSENKDRVATYNKNSYEKNKLAKREYAKKYYHANKEKEKIKRKEFRERNREKIRDKHYGREERKRLRLSALEHYGMQCSCCGEKTIEFLCIDHVNGGGNKHRKVVGGNTYRWLKQQGYPKGFRTLCHNCNSALGFYGYCPHQK